MTGTELRIQYLRSLIKSYQANKDDFGLYPAELKALRRFEQELKLLESSLIAPEDKDLCNYDRELKKFLLTEGYYNIRFLEDGCIANYHMLYTTAVVIDITECGYTRRICYPKGSGLAEKMCLQMKTFNDTPLPGYTALK